MPQTPSGVTTAIVTDNNDPDGLCRVRVRYAGQDASQPVHWARLAMPMAGVRRGVVMIPEVGDEVLVAFDRGDARLPYVVGALWNASAPPPEANRSGRNERRVIQTRSGHRLAFDDGTPGSVELAAHDGRKIVMDERGVSVQDAHGNHVRIDGASGAIEIATAGRLTIKANEVAVEATAGMELKAGGVLTLRGTLININ